MLQRQRVSVIIPIYNMEEHLCESLDSVVRQSLQDIEIVCVNDGSTDSSLRILREYSQADPRITILEQRNQGAGKARNRGIEAANGEYVAFMDPDDYYPDRDVLKTLYEKASENSALICGGSFCENHGGRIRKRFSSSLGGYTFTAKSMIRYSDYQFDYGFHRFIYNRNMLKTNHVCFPSYSRFQDPPFFVQAMITAGQFYALPMITYCYRWGHKTKWDKETTNDLVRGITDNLKISGEYGLAKLHAITARRLNFEYLNIILDNITEDNLSLIDLLRSAESLIQKELLEQAGLKRMETLRLRSMLSVDRAGMLLRVNKRNNDIQGRWDSVLRSLPLGLGHRAHDLSRKVLTLMRIWELFGPRGVQDAVFYKLAG